MKCLVNRRLAWIAAFAFLALVAGPATRAQAQNEPALSDGEKKLEDLLKANNLLVQKTYDAAAQRWHFVTDFSVGSSGESTRVLLNVVPRLTLPNGTVIYLVQALSVVTALPQGQTFSPTIIKTVSDANGKVYTGSYNVAENLIIASNGAYMMDMSPDGLFMILFDLHLNKTVLAQRLKDVSATEQLEN